MNIIKNILSGMVLMSAVLFTPSCDSSLSEINISPNNLPDDEIDIKYVMTGVLTRSAVMDTYWGYDTGDLTAGQQYLQRDFTSYDENNLQWDARDFYYFYEQIKDSEYIYGRAETEKTGEEKNFYQAVALIMKSYWYGFITSAYGDVPYSKAMQAEKGGDEFFKPVYDEQIDIFKGILEDLKTANELLKSVTVVNSVVDEDLVFNGDGMKWRKFANSLRLRFYMRLSEKTGIDINPAAEISTIVNDQNQYPIMVDNGDNASVGFVGTDRLNSWPGGPLKFSFRSEFYRRKPSSTIVKELISLNDPRLTAWVRPVDIQLKQGATNELVVENGAVKRYIDLDINAINTDGNKENDINTSLYVGLAVALTSPNDFNLGGTVNALRDDILALDGNMYLGGGSNPHASYLTEMYAENSNDLVRSVFMNCAEVDFTLAEASARGWITGDAYDYYKSGIENSFDQYAISDGDPSSVYDEANNTLIAFDQTAYIANAKTIYDNSSDKLEPIINQKWISLWLMTESWFDWRRTGYPDLNINIISGTKGQNTPLRFYYNDPYNDVNMVDAINRLVPAENDQWSKMWLLQ